MCWIFHVSALGKVKNVSLQVIDMIVSELICVVWEILKKCFLEVKMVAISSQAFHTKYD